MKANELRIGNLVNSTGEDGGCVKVCEIGHLLDRSHIAIAYCIPSGGYSQTSLEEDETDPSEEEFKLIQPIPLTTEWLVKLGLDASDLFIVREAIANFRGISEDDVILDYVHEIQNAWALLEGQELEIKL